MSDWEDLLLTKVKSSSAKYRHQLLWAASHSSAAYLDDWDESWRENVKPEPSIARARARNSIAEYLADGLVTADAAIRGLELIRDVFARDTVYATVAPDGTGGLIFYWRAGTMSIEIDVYADVADGYWWHINDVAAVTDAQHHAGMLSNQDKEHLAFYIERFSKEVDCINPDWRSQQY